MLFHIMTQICLKWCHCLHGVNGKYQTSSFWTPWHRSSRRYHRHRIMCYMYIWNLHFIETFHFLYFNSGKVSLFKEAQGLFKTHYTCDYLQYFKHNFYSSPNKVIIHVGHLQCDDWSLPAVHVRKTFVGLCRYCRWCQKHEAHIWAWGEPAELLQRVCVC